MLTKDYEEKNEYYRVDVTTIRTPLVLEFSNETINRMDFANIINNCSVIYSGIDCDTFGNKVGRNVTFEFHPDTVCRSELEKLLIENTITLDHLTPVDYSFDISIEGFNGVEVINGLVLKNEIHSNGLSENPSLQIIATVVDSDITNRIVGEVLEIAGIAKNILHNFDGDVNSLIKNFGLFTGCNVGRYLLSKNIESDISTIIYNDFVEEMSHKLNTAQQHIIKKIEERNNG